MFALLLAFSVLDALLIVAQALFLAYALSWMCSCAVSGVFDDLVKGAVPGILGFACSFVARSALGCARDGFADRFARKRASELRSELVDAVYEQGVSGVQRLGSGSLVQELIDGVSNVRNYLAVVLPKTADLVAIPLVLAIALFAVDWISGIIALVILPCIIGYMKLLGANAKAQAAAQHREYGRLANHFMDTLRGLSTLKVFGRSKPYAKQVFAVSEAFREATVKTLRTATLSSLVLDLFRTFALAAVAIMLGFRLLNGDVGLQPALAVLIMVPEYFAAVRRYSLDFHASLDGRNSFAFIRGVIDGASAASGCDCRLPERAVSDDAPTLEFRDVTFSHEKGGPAVLHEVNFKVEGPCKVGIVGVSGSGKSTLANLIAGFSNPSSGGVLVDGTKAPGLNDPSWLKRVTYIPQNPHVFNASLRDNVAFYKPNASSLEVDEAVRLAGLDEFVSQLPDGLDTLMGQQGRQLSGGQAQRVALARAFLEPERKVLVLDEPTAHLDIVTELSLKQRMLPLMEGRLVFFATHRLHWLKDMDYVMVMGDGRVVEQGSPDHLLASEGALSDLVERMRGGGLA